MRLRVLFYTLKHFVTYALATHKRTHAHTHAHLAIGTNTNCFLSLQVMGITVAGSNGHFELNVFKPVIVHTTI